MKNLAIALVKAQTEMQTPKKGSVNPFFKNKYSSLNDVLEAIVPALNNNGIVLLQPLVNIDGKNFVKTVLMHESGEVFESLAEIFCSKQNDAQAYGSGISYARRYSLSSICGIGSEDDDAQKAVQKPKATDEILRKAKEGNFTIEQVKTKYSLTTEQEKNYGTK
jgi:ERF superfamily